MEVVHNAVASDQYGPLQANFTYDVRNGYTAIAGPNNAGKSAILQLIFRSLVGDQAVGGPGRIALILPDREYVDPTTQTGTRLLSAWNQDLVNTLAGEPLPYGTSAPGPMRSELVRLLLHGDLIVQVGAINELLVRLGLQPFRLRGAQEIYFEDVRVFLQGSGIRAAMPILAALTNEDVRIILIDEPELSLEPRLQKVLRDVLVEAAETRIIIVATHSHLFLQRDVIEANQVVGRSAPNQTEVRTLAEPRELYDLVFDLLGSSTEDLFFPGNYVIVEGASDQAIVEKVLTLLGKPSPTIKVLSARGIDTVRDAVESVYRASVPLIVNDSPYAGKVVAIIDEPGDPDAPNVRKLRENMKDRLYVLDKPSLEEYMPGEIYSRAGLDKDEELKTLVGLRGNRAASEARKREISKALAAEINDTDFESIRLIVDAAQRAIDEST
jgi:hypothetical protein